VVLDRKMTMESQVDQICRVAYQQIRDLYKIRSNLTMDATKSAVQALVTNRLDFSNAVLSGISKRAIKKLQKVQNCAARLIYRIKRREHITPKLMDLHWLKIEYRLQYKINMLTFKCMKGMAPQYLMEMLQPRVVSYGLRSTGEVNLVINQGQNRLRPGKMGERAFIHTSPTLWNKLPTDVKNAGNITLFKKRLKHYLFKKCYDL